MRTVWKFPFSPNSVEGDTYEVVLSGVPQGAKPLCVMVQHGITCLWAEVNPNNAKSTLTLYCVGTGFGAVPAGKTYLDTVVCGPYVWHLYY